MLTGITAVIPTIPPRAAMLSRTLGSVLAQTLPVAAVSVAADLNREGAPKTRDRALRAAQTEWVAFSDDDDTWLPEHLAVLTAAAEETGADYVFSYFTIVDPAGKTTSWDPLGYFGKPFNPDRPHQTTITTLVRTELAQQVGFRQPPTNALIDGQRFGEDFQFTLDCVAAGAHIVHVPQRTWLWHHHGGNTSGLPTW
jgi:glycosyltransferase involved in cell wall biosynthesis